jgi:AcrR family transcriptional regulator
LKSKRQLQKENTRKKILETAYQIYSEQGFSATTAVIAKEAGVSHGTIFVHFSSLDELLCCLIQDFGDVLGSEIHQQSETKDNIEELLKAHLAVLARYEKFYIRLIAERSLLPEDARLTFSNIQSVAAYHFSKVFEREKNIKNLPVHRLFNTWMGLVHYYLLNKDLFSPDTPVLERYGSELTETFLELIKR